MSNFPRVCYCHAKNCRDSSCTDPTTGRMVPGRLLKRAEYESHQLQEQIWERANQEDRIVTAFTSSTLLNVDVSDATVTRHQDIAPCALSSSSDLRHILSNTSSSDVVTAHPTLPSMCSGQTVPMDYDILPSAAGQVAQSEQIATSDLSQSNIANNVFPSEQATMSDFTHPNVGSDTHTIDFPPHSSDGHLEDLEALYGTLTEEINVYDHEPLRFASPPISLDDPVPSSDSLSAGHAQQVANAKFLRHRDVLSELSQRVESLGEQSDLAFTSLKDAFSHRMQSHIVLLEALVESQWDHEKFMLGYVPGSNAGVAEIYNSSSFYRLALDQTPFVVMMSILTTLVLYLLHGLSRDGASFLLQATQLIASAACLAAFSTVGRSTSTFQEWVRMWPTDIRTALKTLQLDPDSIEFACCKRCCACYPPPNYPQFCTHKETPQSKPCGARLLSRQGSSSNSTPIRRFIYQPFKSWLARFLSRPGIEEVLIKTPRTPGDSPSQLETDIWHGEAFATFEGPTPGSSYFDAPAEELRLVFSLFVDWFNPFGNRASSTSASIGAIYMVCMNLPNWMRYRMENVYLVGIIPGYKEPSLHQINHFLTILVRELNSLWNPGVYFTRTAAYRLGRKVHCAVIPLVCDMPGLRKVAGLAGHGATSLCSLCRIVKGNIDDFQYWTWPRRTLLEHRRQAYAWRDAASETIRESLWNLSTIRWTALLDLPYWDITKYSVVDVMHNLFLGHFRRHCVDIWGMQAPKDDDPDHTPQNRKHKTFHTTEEQVRAISRAVRALKEKSRSRLNDCRRGYLLVLANLNHVPLPTAQPTKKNITEALIIWRTQHPDFDIVSPQPFSFPVKDFADPTPAKREPVIKEDILREVWKDMESTILPSWMGRAPRRFGSAGQGRLKADQWRTACTVHLPVTLIRLWHHLPESAREKQILRNFIYLITAVLWATRRSTSNVHRTIVQNNLHSYLTTLVQLFGARVLVPNHHVSLHIVECLRLFGPVHGWWAFPFERYNGILQGFNSNSRIGELELTVFTSFCRAANFKALMASSSIVSLLKAFQSLFFRFSGGLFKGTLANDLLAFEGQLSNDDTTSRDDQVTGLSDLSAWNYSALVDRLNSDSSHIHFAPSDTPSHGISIQPQALSCSSITMRGVKFTTARCSEGDSMIICRPGGQTQDRAARIEDIYLHTRATSDGNSVTERFLVARVLQDLSQNERQRYDPYQDYPLLGIRLCRDAYETETVLLKASDIVGHFASCPLRGVEDHDFRVVVSLARD